ncbi:hypothetical protein GLOIN_2v1834901 [Rhizophagus irregularis DAOM 181602=DAOM 197198]|nr:hypothetical protein GLOIN_2v1834901 [Rhizophagus irregularis DAOM 181602=DAOM 197198]
MRLNLILFLSILLVILPVKSSIITYEEKQIKTPNVMNIKNFDDGTIVIRIAHDVNYTTPPRTCFEESFSIRTIYPDGTIKEFDISLDIQPFNFCILSKIKFYPIKRNLLFVTFVVAADVNNPYSYDDWGLIVDLDGVIHNKSKLGSSFVNPNTNEWSPDQDSTITLNVHRDDGFLRTTPITNSTGDENNAIQLLGETIIEYPTGHPIGTVATTNGGYAIIYPNITMSTIPFSPQMKLYGIFLEYGKNIIQEPVILYQTRAPILEVTLINCDFAYIGVGQTCILTLNTAQGQNTFVKVDFLSSGTAYDVKAFQSPGGVNYNIKSLRYGGYFLYYTQPIVNDATRLNLYGFILDTNGIQYSWGLPYPTLTNSEADITILPNNTLIIPQPEVGQSWSLISIDLSRIEGARDNGFENLQINATIPEVNAIIDPSETKIFTIKYYDQVDLSPNYNVTILQDDGTGNGIIRQITSISNNNGEFVRYIDDFTIEITVIDSTFNQPNAKYYVLIDNGFVKNRNYQEPIIGIQNSGWSFITKNESVSSKSNLKEKIKDMIDSSINGKVRLTSDGTTYFKSFKHDKLKRKEFFDNLTSELAKAVPVGSERITTNERYEIDTSVSPEQYILAINIKKAKNKDEKSDNSIAEDLDTLIKNKLITVIGSGEYSNYLDHEYGYKILPSWIDKYLMSLIGLVIYTILLIIIAFMFNSFAIIECGISIAKFTMTILFIRRDAGAVENIFTTSLFFVTFPFIVNLCFAFVIVLNELTRFDSNDFAKLLKKVKELLDILDSYDDLLEKGNNHSDHKEKLQIVNNEITMVLKKAKVELKKVKDDLNEFKGITKKLKDANDLISKLESQEEIKLKEVKSIIKNLQQVKKLLEKIDQVENFTKELKEVIKFTEDLIKLIELERIKLKEKLKEINIEEFNALMKEFKRFSELIEILKKVKELDFIKTNKYIKELGIKNEEKISNKRKLKEELKDIISCMESIQVKLSQNNEDYVENREEQKKNHRYCSNVWEESKEQIYKIKDIIENGLKKIKGDQPIKQYRKFSKWLKDNKDNQIIVVIFTILAGVNILHLELLGSMLQIQTCRLNWLKSKVPSRIRDLNFNANLSYAAKRKIFFGNITNIFINDLAEIFIQSFYLSRVVSAGYTPIYIILYSFLHLINNLRCIYKYMSEQGNSWAGSFRIIIGRIFPCTKSVDNN